MLLRHETSQNFWHSFPERYRNVTRKTCIPKLNLISTSSGPIPAKHLCKSYAQVTITFAHTCAGPHGTPEKYSQLLYVSSLFWYITNHRPVVGCRRFETTFDCLIFEAGKHGLSRNVSNHLPTHSEGLRYTAVEAWNHACLILTRVYPKYSALTL
jgi:hypothetical protein